MESEEKTETTRGLRCLVNPLVASDNVFSGPSLTKVLPCAWHSLGTGNSVVGNTMCFLPSGNLCLERGLQINRAI